MTGVQTAPTDTRMMGIVHDALRRDLARAISALERAPGPEDEQRAALGAHVTWMMRFLHAHHHGEDAGLWPLVREREPDANALLATMETDHARIAPLVELCETAARGYGSGSADTTRVALLDALTRLRDVLLPHLQREEDEVMPLVSIAISPAEWRAVDEQYFIKPKSLKELGFEGHWMLDELDAERARVVTHQVPPISRFVLLWGFRRRYRRLATASWGPAAKAPGVSSRGAYGRAARSPRVIPRTGCVETVVAAPIDALWQVASDVTRVGEWSHECRRVEWLDGATKAAPGVRFRGTNKAGPWTWSRINEVVIADEPHTFVWRTVPTFGFPDSSEWRISLEAVDGGTRIVQSYEIIRAPAALSRLYAFVVPSHRSRSTGLTDDLRRLGEVAENLHGRSGVPGSSMQVGAVSASDTRVGGA